MKHFVKPDNSIWAFESDGSQDHLITQDMTPITIEERDALLAPPPVIPQIVTMRQARRALLAANLYTQVNTAIAAMTGPQGDAARIDWEFATTVERSNPLFISLASTLNLTTEQLDALFVAAAGI